VAETRKLIRDALFTLLSSSGSGGFNAQYAASLGSFPSAEAVAIDWSPGITGNAAKDPKQFFWGQVDPAQLDADQILKYPGVAIYTSLADGTRTDKREKARRFSGLITAHIDFLTKHRDGIEKDDIESTYDAIEGATLQCLYNFPSQSNIAWSNDFKCERPPAELLGNGWRQRIPMVLTFFVSV
jgi:hypothetical protein